MHKNVNSDAAQAAAVSRLEDHTGYWLRLVSNHVSQGFSHKVEAAGVTVSEWVVLRAMYDGSCTGAAALTQALGLSKGAISKLLDRLQGKGLVRKTIVEVDRRNQELALTPAGRDLVPELARLADQNDEEFFGRLPASSRAALLAALQTLVSQHQLQGVPVE